MRFTTQSTQNYDRTEDSQILVVEAKLLCFEDLFQTHQRTWDGTETEISCTYSRCSAIYQA